jgi:cytochrome c-type biogenesis protein CcmH/NrfG
MPGAAIPGLPPGAALHPGVPPQAGFEAQQRIAIAEQLVQRDPKNHQAWVQLGNDYFDTHQAQKAVDAYAKALELQPNDPNVMTDQGVMYRELRQYDRAIASFEKANKLDPTHVQSIYNLGVVYAFDLRDPAKAAKYWSRVIETAPGSREAVQARQALASMPPP